MTDNFKRIYDYFDSVKSNIEYAEYCNELFKIDQLLNTFPFDNYAANQLCSKLSTKYKDEIKEKEDKVQNEALEKEKNIQYAMLDIQKKFGKNAILKGTNLKEGATGIERNKQVGGHKA